jgi:acyl-CoA dehydrogenase
MNDEQRLIAETTERIFKTHCTNALVDQAEKGIYPEALWALLAENGLTTLGATTELGGSGGTFGDALVILRQAGRFSLPLPLAENLVAAQLLAESGVSVPDGEMTIVAADLVQEPDGSISGDAKGVPFGRYCKWVFCVDPKNANQLYQLSADQWTVTSGTDLAGCARDDLAFQQVTLADNQVWQVDFDVARLQLLGAAGRAAMMAGALEAALEATVGYALERKQFGKPIAKFQAIQQQLAVFSTHVAASTRAAETLMVTGTLSEIDVAIAKSRIGEAAGVGAEVAHQVFGAIGYTKDHGLNHLTRRLWVWRDEFGHEGVWQTRLGKLLLAEGDVPLWHQITQLG